MPPSPSARSTLIPKAASWEVCNYPALKSRQCLCIPAFGCVGGQSFLLSVSEVLRGRGGRQGRGKMVRSSPRHRRLSGAIFPWRELGQSKMPASVPSACPFPDSPSVCPLQLSPL